MHFLVDICLNFKFNSSLICPCVFIIKFLYVNVDILRSSMELKLHSPVGAEPVVYNWPLVIGRGAVSIRSSSYH